ncbi:putative DNA-binding domain-containing protein [Bdellovibrio sp.]|uniref:HvfC/BufC family peptide modification chaperone n=1 Tax=Bdellovibrio sp. TaxID=28201 RepID=UPI0039E21C71
MKLNEAQSLFKKNLLSAQADPKAVESLKPIGKLSLEQAFEVYHRGYFARLTEALSKTFRAVRWVLGEELFRHVARRYIEAQPSISYDLSDYGETFPEFLKSSQSTRGIVFLYDLARFEWTFKNMYHAASSEPLPVERIRELLHSEDFKIQFIEAFEIFESPYAIFDLWSHRKEPPYQFEDINWNHPECLMIYKKQKKVYVQRLDAIEAQILTELKEGSAVASALADFSSLLTPDKIAQLFQMMMRAGIIEDILVLEN